jgi:pimeloyl-ACP methyl ester carboxylesterase
MALATGFDEVSAVKNTPRTRGVTRFWACACIALAAASLCTRGARAGESLPLKECRLEHPLRLASVDARCGSLSVPEDRSNAKSARIELRIAVIAALNRRSAASPLFILAGGPGQAASALYVSFTAAFARINRNHDVVLVDQRGTGASSPMQCSFPDDWSEAANSPESIRAASQTCVDKLGDRVRSYATAAAVRDLDEVRRALRYERIDLYGASYGTRVAMSYMRRYPQHLDAVILDGVTDPERPIGPDTPEDGERAIGSIIARCAADQGCRNAFPTLGADFNGLKARFGTATAAIRISDPSNGDDLSLNFNHAVFAASLRMLSYSSEQASMLPQLLHRAAQGDLAPLAAQAVLTSRQLGDQLAIGMQNTVVCSEDWPFFTRMKIDRGALQRTYQGTDQLDGLNVICAHWPRGPVDDDLHAPLHSATPTLLLSGDTDPVTPPASAERAARFLTQHRHLILSGEGHGQLATSCVPRLMAEFLDHPRPAQLDAACLSSHRPAAFFLGANGPAP